MGANERKIIADKIKELGLAGQFEIERGMVKTVDEDKFVMDVEIDEDVITHDVRLIAITESDLGLIQVPKVNSYVVIAKMEGGVDYVLVQASELEKLLLKIGTQTLQITANGFIFNGGDNHGLIKILDLINKINTIENDINTLKALFTGVLAAPIPEAGGGAPSAFQAAMIGAFAAWRAQMISLTLKAQIEDTKIKH